MRLLNVINTKLKLVLFEYLGLQCHVPVISLCADNMRPRAPRYFKCTGASSRGRAVTVLCVRLCDAMCRASNCSRWRFNFVQITIFASNVNQRSPLSVCRQGRARTHHGTSEELPSHHTRGSVECPKRVRACHHNKKCQKRVRHG